MEHTIGGFATSDTRGQWHYLRLQVHTSGEVTAGWMLEPGGAVLNSAQGYHPELEVGGDLESGKMGFAVRSEDASSTLVLVDNVFTYTSSGEQLVVDPGRRVRFAAAGEPCLREGEGARWAKPPLYRGSRFLLPAGGGSQRSSRLVVASRRRNIDAAESTEITDSDELSISYVPRYLDVPQVGTY